MFHLFLVAVVIQPERAIGSTGTSSRVNSHQTCYYARTDRGYNRCLYQPLLLVISHFQTISLKGAGIAGLAAAKACKEVGLLPRVFEQSTHVGGIWSPKSKLCRQDMTTNLSRHTCSFSDHPWVAPKPLFPLTSQMGSYLSDYAQKHLEGSIISYDHRVTNVSQTESGVWNVSWSTSAGTSEGLFNYLIVASGFFSEPFIPPLAGFSGEIIHSSAYQDPVLVRDKDVVVVGDSFSAVELAGEISAFAKSVKHIHSRPFWIFPKYLPLQPLNPKSPFAPMDLVFYDRSKREGLSERTLPTDEQVRSRNAYFRTLCDDQGSIAPSLEVPSDRSAFVAVSDYYTNAVRCGAIEPILGRIESCQESKLLLSSGATITSADLLIMATGFTTRLPFFSAAVLSALAYNPADRRTPIILYQNTFHPSPLLKNVAFIGMYRGPYMGVVELRARLAARTFVGSLPFPSLKEQQAGLEQEEEIRSRNPPLQFPHSDYVGLMHDVASALGQEDPKTVWPSQNTDVVTPALFSTCAESIPVNQLLSEVRDDLDAAQRGKFVAAAIYSALQGRWQIRRRLISKTYNLPSGTFTGEASFLRKPIDAKSDDCELKYLEVGQLKTDSGVELEARRAYRYRYEPARDVVEVLFDDLTHFHSMKVLSPEEAPGEGFDGSWEPWEGRESAGWRAVGTHWCSPDDYTAAYWFAFKGIHIEEFRISYKVKGPMKDYVASACYTR